MVVVVGLGCGEGGCRMEKGLAAGEEFLTKEKGQSAEAGDRSRSITPKPHMLDFAFFTFYFFCIFLCCSSFYLLLYCYLLLLYKLFLWMAMRTRKMQIFAHMYIRRYYQYAPMRIRKCWHMANLGLGERACDPIY